MEESSDPVIHLIYSENNNNKKKTLNKSSRHRVTFKLILAKIKETDFHIICP